MKIDPRALRLFLAVCREGTISGAARAEHLSQPSVSVAISQLERTLSTKLFERFRQGIQLTPAGEALKLRAEAVENLLQAAKRETELLGMNASGPMVIGGTPGALSTLIPKVLNSFAAVHPSFELRIVERPEATLQNLLRTYEIDVAVVTAGMREHPTDFREIVLLSDPFALVVGKQNAKLPDTVALPDLDRARWVLPDAIGGFRLQIDALFINAGAPTPRNVIRSDSLLTTKAIVRNTDYVTILPREVVDPELSSGALRAINIREAKFQRKVGLLWLKERRFSNLTKAFIEHTQSVLGNSN